MQLKLVYRKETGESEGVLINGEFEEVAIKSDDPITVIQDKGVKNGNTVLTNSDVSYSVAIYPTY
jgi:hypothetical protein